MQESTEIIHMGVLENSRGKVDQKKREDVYCVYIYLLGSFDSAAGHLVTLKLF